MKHPAYHLRTNKAVDRLLLVDILRTLDPHCRDYTYYSLGGPFLEDLKVMDHFLPQMKLVSLESSAQTFKRQNFNKFSSRIKLMRTTLADFLIHEYEAGSKDVFWLDYTDLGYDRFDEFQTVLKKVPSGSVVRITLRAEPSIDLSTVADRISSEELTRIQTELEAAFKSEFDKVLPPALSVNGIFTNKKRFLQMVQHMIKRAASLALDTIGSPVEYIPVQSTWYNEPTRMLTVTGVVCERSQTQQFLDQLSTVRFANFDWHEPSRIDVPALSMKEILHLEPYLPISSNEDVGDVLFKALDYMIDDGERKSKEQLSHYAYCQRDYPNFVRISI